MIPLTLCGGRLAQRRIVVRTAATVVCAIDQNARDVVLRMQAVGQLRAFDVQPRVVERRMRFAVGENGDDALEVARCACPENSVRC